MGEKLSDYVGNIKCDKCSHKFFKGIKRQQPFCTSFGWKSTVGKFVQVFKWLNHILLCRLNRRGHTDEIEFERALSTHRAFLDKQTHMNDGIKYVETKVVTLKGKEYQELMSMDITKPSVLYGENIDGRFILIEDRDVLYALRVKYTMCVLSLHGVILNDYTLNLNEDEFIIENGKLVILNKEKLVIYNKYVNKENM